RLLLRDGHERPTSIATTRAEARRPPPALRSLLRLDPVRVDRALERARLSVRDRALLVDLLAAVLVAGQVVAREPDVLRVLGRNRPGGDLGMRLRIGEPRLVVGPRNLERVPDRPVAALNERRRAEQ